MQIQKNAPQKNKIFALIDCNNFYASCERVFNPKLKNKPVAILSNNDGIIIARSNEVKKLGIPMGAPVFKWRKKIEENKIHIFSSNYTLYGDMSHRVMVTLQKFSPNVEVYSIDEAFLDLTDLHVENLRILGQKIRKTVKKWTGIPVSVGIAPTKTLAKIANEIGKVYPDYNGVVDLVNTEKIDRFLEKIDVRDIWGVGRQYTKYLKRKGINTAKDLKYTDRNSAKKKMTVQGERIILELNGISCHPLEQNPPAKNAIAATRSFGRYITTLSEMEEAISSFVARTGEKLRKQKSTANVLQVFILTNTHNQNHPQYCNSLTIKLQKPTAYTPELIDYALQGLARIFRGGYRYKKAGVLLFGIQPEGLIQMDMIDPDNPTLRQKRNDLMKMLDEVNKTWGRNTLKIASQGTKQRWRMNQTKKSRLYTTRIDQLLEAKS